MPLLSMARVCARLAFFTAALIIGCNTLVYEARAAEPAASSQSSRPRASAVASPRDTSGRTAVSAAEAQPAARRLPTVSTAATPTYQVATRVRSDLLVAPCDPDDPLSVQGELAVDNLVREVLAQNRSLAALQAAWRAAAQKYPQVVSLADPTFMSLMAPGSFNDPNFQSSFMVGASQQLPWPGKRQWRGQIARAETSVASAEAGDLAVQLAAATRTAFYDYYLARRQLELVNDNSRRLQDFRDVARAKYEANEVTQQDILQADVELIELARQQVELQRGANVTIARINTLLHRLPNSALPPPPRSVATPQFLPEPELLYQLAIGRRPDLAAVAARLRAEQSQLQLAYKEFLPDFDVGGRYDQFWDRANQRGQINVNMNVPVYQGKREAAAREAMWRINQRRAEYEQQIDTIRNDVQAAYERVNESRQVFELYDRRILPAIDQNIKAARAGYEASRLAFLSLIEAQRQLIDGQMKWVEALAAYHRRVAELEQALACPVPFESPVKVEEVPAPQ